MFREYFILLLLGHILADFYTQTAKVAEKKKKKNQVGIFSWHALFFDNSCGKCSGHIN